MIEQRTRLKRFSPTHRLWHLGLVLVFMTLSVTGIAGPSGASGDKPLGLCFWAVAHPSGTEVANGVLPGSRRQVQRHASFAALDLVRRTLSCS